MNNTKDKYSPVIPTDFDVSHIRERFVKPKKISKREQILKEITFTKKQRFISLIIVITLFVLLYS